ncbi:MAG: molybdate ABC transporter substrate-binding protein [Alphaproteobacteria bacterium]|nr:molybdate ABC transporter substrate-binding protein [Alphaproteobacteria bacterium]
MRRFAAFVLAAGLFAAPVARAQELLVFAAASLTDALQQAAKATGRKARFSFAASSTLARQIENGAPADIFASADEDWANYLAERGKLVPGTRTTLLSNQLVLIVPADRKRAISIAKGMDMMALLAGGRLAVGDPALVPAGRYARQSLEWLGIWATVEPRLARAESVRAAMALVERGETPLGIVYATDALADPKVAVAATLPAESHAQIAYPFAIVAGRDTPAARDFLAALQSPAARIVFRRNGFAME